MRSLRPWLTVLILPSLIVPPAPAAAQNGERPPSLLQSLPPATGRNGYEELVLAAETLRSSRYYLAIQGGTKLTLDQKRTVLQDRAVNRSLALVRQGLAKPISQPRTKLTLTTTMPELGPIRDLARVLLIQQYVALAEGRTPEALAAARTGMQLGRALQIDNEVGAMVGISIEASLTQPLLRKLDQLSAKDCQTLQQICAEFLNQPSPQVGLIEAERKWLKAGLADTRDLLKKEGPVAVARAFGLNEETAKRYSPFLPKTDDGIDQLFGQMETAYDSQWERVAAEYRKPSWERQRIQVEGGGDLGSLVAGLLVPGYNDLDESFTKEATRIQLLACHAAIRRFQWEHDRLPDTLGELALGRMAIDPFTGKEFLYEAKENAYTLRALHSEIMDTDDAALSNSKTPLTVTRE